MIIVERKPIIMKFLIASDLHGSAHWCRQLLNAFEREHADRLLLLGDILYHGPRNDLPEEYAPKQVIVLLSPLASRILCVRGNCDTEVDQMVLPFPIMADYAVMPVGERLMYLTHGHHFNEQHLPPLQPGDVLLYGHTHVPVCYEVASCMCLNPGSVSMPKEESWHGYMTLEGGLFRWKDFQGETHMTWQA